MNDHTTESEKIEPPPADAVPALPVGWMNRSGLKGLMRGELSYIFQVKEGEDTSHLVPLFSQPDPSLRLGVMLVVSEIRQIPGIGYKPMLSEIPGVVRARIEALEDDLARHRSERSYIVGCVDGFDAAMEQMTEVLLTARRLVQATIHEEVTEAADWETLADDIDAALAAAPERVRHVKRGSTYRVVGRGKIQTDTPLTDYAEVVVYRGEEDGLIWVRPTAEFDDGRFVATKPEGRADG